MTYLPVLVLNQNYEPLNICRARRAVVLIYRGKAEMLENGSGFIHSTTYTFPLPSVIRIVYMIKRPRPERKLTRLEIFNRDKYICQYCGKEIRQPTLDHIVPRYKGGEYTWGNVVSACVACKRRKAGKTPEQDGIKLLQYLFPSHGHKPLYIIYIYLRIQSVSLKYITDKNCVEYSNSRIHDR